jgi:hypothetical protein
MCRVSYRFLSLRQLSEELSESCQRSDLLRTRGLVVVSFLVTERREVIDWLA